MMFSIKSVSTLYYVTFARALFYDLYQIVAFLCIPSFHLVYIHV